MRLLKIMLLLEVLLLWSTPAMADYNPTNPPEPGVNFTLNLRCVPADAGRNLTPSSSRVFPFGQRVNVSVSGNAGFKFLRWEDEDGKEVSAKADFYYTMPARNVTLTARFEYDPDSPNEPTTPEFKSTTKVYLETKPANAGYFSYNESGKEYNVGESVLFRVNANSNYRFVNWTRDGEVVSESASFYYSIPHGDHTLVANFEYDPSDPSEPGIPRVYRNLTLKTNPEGAATLNGSGSYQEGTTNTVQARANTYYTFVNWTDEDGTAVSNTERFSFTMPNRNVTLTANYTYLYDPTNPGEPGVPEPGGSVGENMVAWPRFGMYDDTHVMILCETEGSVIHYTLDGTDPTASSPVYTEPVYVSSNLLVKAIAYKEGMEDSPIVSYKVSTYHAEVPVFTFENRKIKITSSTPGAVIRYTLDFTEPNQDSEIYTAPFEPEENCRIKAYASKEGLTDSPVSIYVYRQAEHTLPAPTFSVNSEGKLVITPPVSGGTIRYTTDGSEPDASSTIYTAPLTLSGNCTVKAYVTHINYFDSPVGEYIAVGYRVERPSYSFSNPMLSFSTSTEDAEIRYTADGSIPDETSQLYNAPLRLTNDCKIIARGFKTNYEPSDTVSFTYLFAQYQLPTPVAEYSDRALKLTCSDAQAQILYSFDQAEWKVYETPLVLRQDCEVFFFARRDGYNDSETGSYKLILAEHQTTLPTPVAEVDERTMTLTCADSEAQIRYSFDGSLPHQEWAVYQEPLVMTGDCEVFFYATREWYNDSETGSYNYILADHIGKLPTPVAEYSDRALRLTCSDPQAQILYSFDQAEWKVYEAPLVLREDCEVFFYATREWYNDSDMGSYKLILAEHQTTLPTPVAEVYERTMTLTCEDPEAQIRYSFDGSLPHQEWAVYQEPLVMTGDCEVFFYATREWYNDSETGSYQYILADHIGKLPTPVAEYSDRALRLTCSDPQAQILYSFDRAEWKVYEAPLVLREDCEVFFYATREGYKDSDMSSYKLILADHQTTLPIPVAEIHERIMTLTCEDPEAQIRYSFDGSLPHSEWADYQEPLEMTGDCEVFFYATREWYNDSETGSYQYILADHISTVTTPKAHYANRFLILSCDDSQAQIFYSFDGNQPISEWTEYVSPIPMYEDCTVSCIAKRQWFNDSEIISFEFILADYKEVNPVIEKDFRNRQVLISHPDSRKVTVRIGEAEVVMETPAVINVDPGMEGVITVTTLAADNDRYDSDPVEDILKFHHMPDVRFDGHILYATVVDDETIGAQAELVGFFNDNMMAGRHDYSIEVSEFGWVEFAVLSDVAFRSEPYGISINYYNTGREVGARGGSRLSEGFGTWGDRPDDYTTLRVKGEINNEDLQFLGSLPALTALELAPDQIESSTYDNVLADSRIEALSLNIAPNGLLKGMERLTTVVWDGDNNMPDGFLAENGNPNIMLWLKDNSKAPADALNIVTYEYAGEGIPQGADVTGHSEMISLQPGYAFKVHIPLKATHIELSKDFTQTTEIGVCRGWETIALPFSPTSITHETRGEIVPFALWSGDDYTPRPFWLYRSNSNGWEAADVIKAGMPYIISMPNNKEYVESYNLPGKVTFSAENVELTTDNTIPLSTAWVNNTHFEATFMPVEDLVLSLNVDDNSGVLAPGSKFVPDAVTLPFGAYVKSDGGTLLAMPVFGTGDLNGVMLPVLSTSGDMTVDTPGPGKIRICSVRNRQVTIYSMSGMAVCTLQLSAGEPVCIDNLTGGLYIAGGVKVFVK